MRMSSIFVLAGLSAASLGAQGFTSPAGYLTTEGSSVHDYILFKYTDMRFQQIDNTSIGNPAALVQRIAWRRDGSANSDPAWGPRTMDIEVVLSHSVPAATASLEMDENFTSMTTTAFTMKPVNLPDWSNPPASAPAPFDLVLQLDTPWLYLGTEPYLWQVRTQNNNAAADYGNDYQTMSGSFATANTGTVIGTGCTATGAAGPMTLESSVYNVASAFRLDYSVTNAPANAPVFINLDLTASNVTVPGLCTQVVAMPTIPFQLGMSDATGNVDLTFGYLPFNAAAVGVTLVTQSLAPDSGQAGLPIALSNGRSNVVPSTPSSALQTARLYEYRISPGGSMRAPSRWTGGLVTRLD